MFDVSEANGGEPFDTLSDALNYADNVLLDSQKKGGMTIKYIQSSDNKYVQYRLSATSFSTTENDWKDIDNVETTISSTEADLDISDDQDNVLVRFSNGHIKVKNFDSADVLDSIQAILSNIGFDSIPEFDEEKDYAIGDIVRYDKLLYVFTSAHTAGDWDENEVEGTVITPVEVKDASSEADLDISDDQDNVLVRFSNGHVITKNFNSATVNEIEHRSIITKGTTSGISSSAINYNFIGLKDTACEKDGLISYIHIKTEESGDTMIASAKWDETHGYIDIDYQFTINCVAGVNVIPIYRNIKKDYQLFVIGGIKPLATDDTNHIIAGNENVGDSPNSIWEKQVSCYFAWIVIYPAVTINQEINTIKDRLIEDNQNIDKCNRKIDVVNDLLDLTDEQGYKYRIIVSNGQLALERITISYNKILIISHSFGCILGGVWDRGMSSSKVSTDWVHQILSPLNVSTLDRVNGVIWEQHQDNPTAYLSSMLDSHLTIDDIDAIFIMLGGNIPISYQNNAETISANYSELINYIKVRSSADIYVCSPGGHTDEYTLFNRTIKSTAENNGCVYISTWWNDSQKHATMGDAIIDASTNNYWFINSAGRVDHPNDRWHLYMANRILLRLGHQELNKLHNINVVAATTINYHCYSSWVEGGRCSIVIYNSTAPSVNIQTVTGRTINGVMVDLSDKEIPNTSPMPKFTYHFDMPNEDINITINN